MTKDKLCMSRKEISRLRIIHKVMEKRLTQKRAGEILRISERQVRRIIEKVERKGDEGIIHGNRGRPAVNRLSKALGKRILSIVKRKYEDFGPTFAAEKLCCHNIFISREKLRQIMISGDLWTVGRRKRGKAHTWRERKPHRGEMVQMDGSEHDWLEGRGPRMVLMGYVDDATNTVHARFYPYEGTQPAMDSFWRYIERYGIPCSIYYDKHSTYKTTRSANLDEELQGEVANTQFTRALKELGVNPIWAHSPQAKGRVERTFGTFQDRLVKELRLVKVSSLSAANQFLEDYLPTYNAQFAKPPLKRTDLHRSIPKRLRLDDIFCLKESRVISNGYVVTWRNRVFLIQNASLSMRGKRVLVLEHFEGKLDIQLNGKKLRYSEVTRQDLKALERSQKKVLQIVRKAARYVPTQNHPWRRFAYGKRRPVTYAA